MKRLLTGCTMALLVGTAALPLSASAQGTFNQNVGCGVGSIIMKERDSTIFQVLAVTTNQILFNQTFGITSGTLECQQPVTFAGNMKLQRFVAANMDAIAQDMAAGSGESLATVAELMEVPAERRAGFYAAAQRNFEKVFTSASVDSAQVIDNLAAAAL